MSAPVETALVDEPLRAVARRMLENRLKHLVVVDNARRIVGIVSRRDLLRAFDRTDTEIAAGVVDALTTSEYSRRVAVTVDGGVVTLEGRCRGWRTSPPRAGTRGRSRAWSTSSTTSPWAGASSRAIPVVRRQARRWDQRWTAEAQHHPAPQEGRCAPTDTPCAPGAPSLRLEHPQT